MSGDDIRHVDGRDIAEVDGPGSHILDSAAEEITRVEEVVCRGCILLCRLSSRVACLAEDKWSALARSCEVSTTARWSRVVDHLV